MCGITGIFSFNLKGSDFESQTRSSVSRLSRRGPDVQLTHSDGPVNIGHSRLSIIDPGEQSNQPFLSDDGKLAVVFNGEFYNHRDFRKELSLEGYEFRTESDAEVILHLYRKCGYDFIKYINGCFAVAVWDSNKGRLLVARDRLGIKPLYYYHGDDFFAFASEMKALLEYPVPRELDQSSLYAYLQLNYVPDNNSMLRHIYRLKPGSFMEITREGISQSTYYEIPDPTSNTAKYTYTEAMSELEKRMDNSVRRRLLSDVPLAAFLSGGIDSSVVVALASRHTKHLTTYSLGFEGEAFFDETKDAEIIAGKFNTNHHSFRISKTDMLNDLPEVLDYIDEPFADSSALAVYSLSKYTAKNVRVALSGDGADEMFAGYNKHLAHKKAMDKTFRNRMIRGSHFLWRNMPQSRHTRIGNRFRQLNRYSGGLKMSADERYWRWCSLMDEKQASRLMNTGVGNSDYLVRKNALLHAIKSHPDSMQAILYSDMHMVLPQDMLVKTDMMSMSNGLEVRVPFLDHNVVDFAFTIPFGYKLSGQIKKRILKEAFADELPEEILKKPKQGFEVPLLSWFRNELSGKLNKEVFNSEFLREQGIFNPEVVMQMKKKLYSSNPGDVHAGIWALLVFQSWWKKTMM
jgi:asparagine synthase (glutamine-hydrolysing)